ncbi:Glycosyl transferase family 2 [Butyrivibrio sp. ob235]|uniref:glycosyltransferase family 2 protein n=1 Tax=Butyrivibrio sp. ob235 TaxID=1761780 RepID=UPI0008D1C412|nr:glycosyltransferase [Butyrivibrio sp. ob235]SEL73523.1 Glycosyl transferase family 2 [Butyrivibrio sp. ob235]
MGENRMKVSVVVATYNQEKYIGHTLESIVSQKTDFSYEVLVGDDCSTDGTTKIVETYAEKYPGIVIPYIRKKNLGMYANLPELMTHAKGEYIALIEGDDYWIDEKKLQKQVDFLDANKDYIACFGQCIIVDENDVRHPEREEYSPYIKEKREYTIKDFEKYVFPGQTATAMYRSSGYGMLQKKVIDAKIDPKMMVDVAQVLCMLSVGRMYNLGEDFAAYRYVLNENSGSWSSKNDGYGVNQVINYLDGLKNLEQVATALGMQLDFDDRRTYELNKLNDNIGIFSREDTYRIRQRIKEDYNSKQKYYKACLKNVFKGRRRT